MSIEIIWQLPARGDARYADAETRRRGERHGDARAYLQEGVSDPRGNRFNYFDHLQQIARASELAGFDGIVVQHDPLGDESWIISSYIARSTRTLRIITEFEGSWGSAVYAAKNAVSFQRFTGGRLAWQLSRGASEAERRRHADPVADADVAQRIDELLTVARGVITTAPYSFKGRFFGVQDGGFRGSLSNHPVPPVYLSGETSEAHTLSARQADVHVLPARLPVDLVPSIQALRTLAAQHAEQRQGRPLRFGVRVDLLGRETEAEARRDAERYAKQTGRSEAAIKTSSVDRLWRGLSVDGADATLVGSYEQLIDQLEAYAELGITSFVLGGAPHLEEAYRLGTHVLPALRRKLSTTRTAA